MSRSRRLKFPFDPENAMLKRIASLLLLSVVAACGGGGDAGCSVFGSSGTGATTCNTSTSANTAADLLLTASSASLDNTGSAGVTITATALDASRNALSGVGVTLSVDNDAVLSGVSGSSTGTSGAVTATLGVGANQANRLLTVTATSGSVSKTLSVQVSGTTVKATLVPAVAPPGSAAQVQYKVTDKLGNPMVNQAVTVVAAGMSPTDATGVTDSNGAYTFSYTASNTVGSYPIIMTVAGVTDTQTVSVQPTSTVPVVTAAISGASVSATPSVVAVNLPGSTTNQSVVRALFQTTGNQPLANVRVKFDLNGDPNSVGGTFSAGSGILYSDANGVVTTSYVPGTRSSPTNGVTVRACYGVSDTDPNLLNCATSAKVTLTVVGEALGVTIGTNNQIIPTTLTYIKQYVVTVADAAGNPKSGATLATSVDLPTYRKGFYQVVTAGTTTAWTKVRDVACANEDTNRNGVLDTGEDVNLDNQLWPRKPDVTITLLDANKNRVSTTTTGSDGTAILQIEYAQDHASWVDALITVVASGVGGSEGRASYLVIPTPVPSTELTNTQVAPPFAISPYGTATACTNPN
ncbi:MAG: hypothetical protein QM736_26125 [Vicinamibacterales bacterium]